MQTLPANLGLHADLLGGVVDEGVDRLERGVESNGLSLDGHMMMAGDEWRSKVNRAHKNDSHIIQYHYILTSTCWIHFS